VADVQMTVGLRRKACKHRLVFAGFKVGNHDIANEMAWPGVFFSVHSFDSYVLAGSILRHASENDEF
jgi:hypothetical protein